MVWVETYWHPQWNSQYIAVKFDAGETAEIKKWVSIGTDLATIMKTFPPASHYAEIIAAIGGVVQFLLDWNDHNGKGIGIHFCDPRQSWERQACRAPFLWSN
jgi:hypothetical protein